MKESSICKSHFGDKDEPSIFHTNVESIAKSILERNTECELISHDGEEWMIRIPNHQVRHPKLWIKVSGEQDETADELEDID